MICRSLLLLFFSFLLIDQVSARAFYKSARFFRTSAEKVEAREMEFEVGGYLFNTSAYYDYDGNEVEKTDGVTYSKIDVKSIFRYGVGHRLEVRGGVNYRQTHSKDDARDLYNDGVESYLLGFKYQFPQESGMKWRYAVDGYFAQTAYSNVEYSAGTTPPHDEIILGDHGSSYMLGMHMGYRESNTHNVSLFAGYHSPPNHLSPEVIFDFRFRLHGSIFGLFAGVNGVYALGLDDFADEPSSKPLLPSGNTNLFNSINRNWVSPYGGIDIVLGDFKVTGAGRMVMSGASTDKGMEMIVKLTWNSGGSDYQHLTKISKFKEYSAEGEIIQVSPRQTFVKINQGSAGNFEKGMRVDIFRIDYFGGNILVASGHVFEAHATYSIIKVTTKFQGRIDIRKGMVVRGQ